MEHKLSEISPFFSCPYFHPPSLWFEAVGLCPNRDANLLVNMCAGETNNFPFSKRKPCPVPQEGWMPSTLCLFLPSASLHILTRSLRGRAERHHMWLNDALILAWGVAGTLCPPGRVQRTRQTLSVIVRQKKTVLICESRKSTRRISIQDDSETIGIKLASKT